MSVTAPAGFRASGVTAGFKPSGKPDLALVVNDGPAYAAAGVFTRNRVKAAPVLWSQQVVADGTLHAVVLNSGVANACTGSRGFADTHQTAESVAGELGASAADTAVCSTGLIGAYLPMNAVRSGVPTAVASLDADGGPAAAEAIMTTDTHPKTAVATGDGYIVGGMAKGAGMLAPALATMLVVVTTDARAEPEVLDRVLRTATRETFERVDSDGCLSTNDTVLLLANGASGVEADEQDLAEHVTACCADLARQLVADAEGASKDVRIDVTNALTEDDALEVARGVARSNLVKCALAGEDPNWGRILAAVGATAATFDPQQVAVAINGVWVCRDGAPGDDRAKVDMTGRDVVVAVDLGAGTEEATVWTNDLTAAYVHENSAYST